MKIYIKPCTSKTNEQTYYEVYAIPIQAESNPTSILVKI